MRKENLAGFLSAFRIGKRLSFGVVLCLRCVLEHLAASSFALAAFLGALFHVLIVVKLRALLAASTTGFSTGVADEVGEHALARGDTRGGGAMVGAIQTGSQSGLVLLFSLGDHVLAMGCAGIAGALTVAAGFGASLVGMSMMLLTRRLVIRSAESTQGQQGRHARQRSRKCPHRCTSKEDPKVYPTSRRQRQKKWHILCSLLL